MSREIKFRWWNGHQMFHGKNLCVLAKNLKSPEYMQYTGLEDSIGVEIYEGDIIERDRNCLWNDGRLTESVEFKHGSFYLGAGSLFNICVGFYPEVIGNIYENPELMEAIA